MEEEIGIAAGTIWQELSTNGGSTLPQLRKTIARKTPVFDWAIGWLAREDKIAITAHKRTFSVRLKGTHASAVGAS
jgi:Winged helix-turn-helix domain (DUF2582)